MGGVLVGFTVIFAIITVGYLLGRSGALGPHGEQVLSRLVFLVATPALLFDTLSRADLTAVFSPSLVVASTSALISAAVFYSAAKLILRRSIPECVVGALSASYVNSVNLGLPIAVYVLGDATLIAPLLLFQVVILGPIALAVLDITAPRTTKSRSPWALVAAPMMNPILIGAVLGLGFSATNWTMPEPVAQPIALLAGLSVPGALIAFGVSLHGKRALQRGVSPRRDVVLAAAMKTVFQPTVALLIGAIVLGLEGTILTAVVVLAALPTAQNVFVYASWYRRGVVLARDAAIVSTVASVPVIAVAAILV
ncbi:AEC family transporter [Hoyosella rhizosphaerae]|uniref:Membrane protein n=1 Tax=Hoyosella rhizosphaerae TaxID=1755582 RepID=A0A916UBU1_9ACTN|nr:AEC family transporter [Hoyosella rhizosphaerae]MBN4925796.1 AEC family transporter [Hoyosella rhizosphaerae]GGC67878.1 membrane protein [Hoyosella rhizosphaerae]